MTRIAISGHRGLSSEVETLIDRSLRAELAQYAASDLVGISCLADGADQLFARAVVDSGGRLEVVVPAEQYRNRLPDHAHRGYDELVSRAATVRNMEHVESSSRSHMDASVEMLKDADLLFAVWDGLPARAFGGTADVVSHARRLGVPVAIIWPDGAYRD